jgi:hypothetical protein
VSLTITHTTDAGTLLEGSSKGDGAWQVLKPRGWKFSGRVGIYVPYSRDNAPKRGLIDTSAEALRAAGFTVDVDIADGAPRAMEESEADRADRMDDRAERLTERAQKHAAAADARDAAEHAILDGIPFGQPILVGHHSEGRHRRDLARAESHRVAARDHQAAADRAAAGARSAEIHMAARENPVTTANRIEKLEAELRDIARKLTPCRISGRKLKPEAAGRTLECPACYADRTIGDDLLYPEHGAATGAYREQLLERRPFTEEQLRYWREVRDDQRAAGRVDTVDWSQVRKGDAVKIRGQWRRVARVNAKTVSVETGYTWTDRCPKHEVSEHKAAASV